MSMRNLPMLTPKPQAEPEISRWAMVTQQDPLRIRIDGDVSQLPFTPDTLIPNLVINNRVKVLLTTSSDPTFRGRRVLIIGKANGPPSTPAFATRANTTQSIPNDTETAINFTSEIFDTRNGHNGGGGTPSRYTPPCAGYYILAGFVSYAANATGLRSARWWKNGSTYEFAVSEIPAIGGAGQATVVHAPTITVPMNGTTDYIELVAKQNSGAALNVTFFTDAMSRWSATWLGPL